MAAYALYSALFIYRGSFLLNGERYFVLNDDPMVSMTYARNLAHGYGLVWNPGGERVEGFTNLLWVGYMALFHLFPIPDSKVSLFIQISGLLFMIVNLFLVKKIAGLISEESTFVTLGAVFLTAFYYPLNSWSLNGWEVCVLTPLMGFCTFLALKAMKLRKVSMSLYFLLGIATLIRIDMAVPFFAFMIFLALVDSRDRIKNLFYGSLVLVFFLLSQTLFRLWYFHDVLPNTYYLKMVGYPVFLRITRGIYVVVQYIFNMNWILVSLPFWALMLRRDKTIFFLYWILFFQFVYSIYVGGDIMDLYTGPNRFVSIVMPIFFVLFCCSIVEIAKFLTAKLAANELWVRNKFQYAKVILLGVSLLQFNCFYDFRALLKFSLLTKPWSFYVERKLVETAKTVQEITTPHAKVAVFAAGIIPYFSERFGIDLLGKNDRIVAREKMKTFTGLKKLIMFAPGHLKWDLNYSINQLKPDVVTGVPGSLNKAKPFLKPYKCVLVNDEACLCLLETSPNIQWNKVKLGEPCKVDNIEETE